MHLDSPFPLYLVVLQKEIFGGFGEGRFIPPVSSMEFKEIFHGS